MATWRGAREETGARTRRVSGARASGAGDAVNGKYEKKTVTVDAPRYQVVLVDTNLGSADMNEALHQDSRIKKLKMTTSMKRWITIHEFFLKKIVRKDMKLWIKILELKKNGDHVWNE